jgi:hypothetical protein
MCVIIPSPRLDSVKAFGSVRLLPTPEAKLSPEDKHKENDGENERKDMSAPLPTRAETHATIQTPARITRGSFKFTANRSP